MKHYMLNKHGDVVICRSKKPKRTTIFANNIKEAREEFKKLKAWFETKPDIFKILMNIPFED